MSGERDGVLLSCLHLQEADLRVCACALPPDKVSRNEKKNWIYRGSRMNRTFHFLLLVTGTRDSAGGVPVVSSPSHFQERTKRLNCNLGSTSFGPPGCPARCYLAKADSVRSGYGPFDLDVTCSSWRARGEKTPPGEGQWGGKRTMD